ncbi:MAG: potassium-transporting ATPase subunit KdpC [Gammaproteobacteria bacterium]|nr:potassium-transporting ATPase subunit KdpC [Gammaproteobacteria bacterium]MBU1725627.1 potassium-transporting ATPase subunit KdpC [Gammaproteobacteria bacterium]MBU2004021.1 potassium-transporting ATPase subunit KdpC [Gammaproteobacteria bacterium]
MLKDARPALVLLFSLSIVTGGLYPALITGVAQSVFPVQANGSLLESGGKVVGSRLIGQPFSGSQYFWGRPSATAPMPYNAAASAGSNLGPLNPALEQAVKERIAALKASNPEQQAPIPVDLVTASASGLDPHISVAAALWQVSRIARERHMSEDKLNELVARYTEGRAWGILGEPRVNVLMLNLELDKHHG